MRRRTKRRASFVLGAATVAGLYYIATRGVDMNTGYSAVEQEAQMPKKSAEFDPDGEILYGDIRFMDIEGKALPPETELNYSFDIGTACTPIDTYEVSRASGYAQYCRSNYASGTITVTANGYNTKTTDVRFNDDPDYCFTNLIMLRKTEASQ